MIEFIFELLNVGLSCRRRISLVQRRDLVDQGRREEVRVLGGERDDLLQDVAVLLRLHAADDREDEF